MHWKALIEMHLFTRITESLDILGDPIWVCATLGQAKHGLARHGQAKLGIAGPGHARPGLAQPTHCAVDVGFV